jgi:ferredoxin/flavodoxin---NADP+ reductase
MWNYKIIVIGGGPVGIYAADKLHAKGVSYHVFEAETVLGGQPIALYPEKEVDDVPFVGVHSGQGVVQSLLKLTSINDFSLGAVVTGLVEKEDHVEVTVNGETLTAEYVLLATGLGFHVARKMGIPDEEKCANILYAVKDFSIMANKHVVIFGGGDSALDWAKAISAISPFVSLVHRRTEFRGNPDTIKGCKVDLYLPFVPDHLTCVEGMAKDITIKHVDTGASKTLACDYVLVNYGQIPTPSTFNLPLTPTGFGVVVDSQSKASPRIFAVGDCAYLPDKKKRIQPGMEEVDAALTSLGI